MAHHRATTWATSQTFQEPRADNRIAAPPTCPTIGKQTDPDSAAAVAMATRQPTRPMFSKAHSRPLATLLTIAACTAALTAHGLRAQGIPVGFEESYALAKDRASVVANLIPGTEDWYYYHCRERLDVRDFATVRQVLPTWIKRHGRSARVIEIENRDALLSFGDNQERTFQFLRNRLGAQFNHERIVPGQRSDLPTRLDPALVSPTTLTQRALNQHRNSVDGFTDRALATLANNDLDDRQLHSLLSRLQQPDVPNLPALIVRDLAIRESRGFGSLAIHNQLRREQLDQCLELRRELLQDSKFVDAYLTRLQPDADTAWNEDAETREQHLSNIWNFARGLSPSFNSLKAHILFHWLQHDLVAGAPNKDRFLNYIRLPRRSGHTSQAHIARFGDRNQHVDPRGRYPTLMRPIGDDSELVQDCLEYFFQSEDSIDAYSEYLDANWLKTVLAETKILRGDGDMERWYSLLNDPSRLEQLEKQVELRFPKTLKQHYGQNDPVALELETKNVKSLLVKVFAIDSYRYHIEKQKSVDASIELDGVVANFEQTYNYDDAPLRRVKRSFDLPMLKNPGTYVVEFVGNGISSRAVIHKGGLRIVERTSAAGQLVRVYDEAGQHVNSASAWFGGREYAADESGEILVPFTSAPGSKKLVVRHGNRSSLVPLWHQAESYQLHNSVHVAREALIAGNTARLLIRPQLSLAGHSIGLQLLSKPVLTIVATDLDGQSTTQEVRDLKFTPSQELTHDIRIPNRLAALQVTLTGQVEDLNGKKIDLRGDTQSFALNGIDATAETSIPMLMNTSSGYVVELRGKSGEVQVGRTCNLQMFHRDYTDAIQVNLQTDELGRIQLGKLPGIERMRIQKDGGLAGTFDLAGGIYRIPNVLHGSVGDILRLPYQGSQTAPSRSEFSLLGHNHDAFEHLAIANGFLEVRNLAAGDYVLQLREPGEEVLLRITKGKRDGRYLIGRDRILESTAALPLQVQSLTTDDSKLRIKVANGSSGTRVHVITTRYMPTYDLFADLRGEAQKTPVAIDQERFESSYHAGRKLSEEYRYVLERRFTKKYPGNMLERPSMLLNPMTLEENSWNKAIGMGGGAGGKFGGRAAGRGGPAPGQAAGEKAGAGINAGVSANLDYLPQGAVLLENLQPDDQGYVTLPLASLGQGQHVHVLALDGTQAVYETMVRAEQPLQPRSRTLPNSLASDQHFIETKHIEFVQTGATASLDDAHAAQIEVHDSLGSIYRLFATITKDDSLQSFAFLLEWPKLTRAQKLEHYSSHACHELHFFLSQKDPEFFRGVVRPFLANKLDKTFLDKWLLEMDLKAYLDPWQFAQLNLIEKILLAQRLGGAEQAAVARSLREALELNPVAESRLAELFDLALKSEQLTTTGADNYFLGDTRRQNQADKAGLAFEPAARMADSLSAGGPAGPVTGNSLLPHIVGGGAGGRTASARPAGDESPSEEGLAKKRKEQSNEKDEKQGAETELVEELRMDDEAGEVDRQSLRELARRRSVRSLYQPVGETKLLVEHNYWQRRMENPTTGVVAPNSFWVAYALKQTGQPFVSASVVEATGSFLEMMMALSVIDLPFAAGKHEMLTDGGRDSIRAASPLLLVRKEITAAKQANETAALLLGENFFRLDDRYRWNNGERQDAFVSDEFLVDVAYGCQVVVTNPTSSQRTAEVLLQVPAGAVPLQRGFWTKGRAVQLAPYATATIEFSFYFPSAGEFAHYPTQASEKGKLAAFATAKKLNVVDEPSKLDTTSWEHVSQQGSAAEVMSFLDSHNVQRLDLSKIAWRMRDRAFFASVLPKLKQRHVYDQTLWSYGLLHRDADATREYVRHRDDFLDQCGMWLDSPLVSIHPKERLRFQHLELSPLVHQRAHQMGGERKFGNNDLAAQYHALMTLLSYRPQLDSNDWFAVTYYFLLQDRVEEALDSFAKIAPDGIEAKVQYDYLSAYLCFFSGETQKARRIASAHLNDPVAHWQSRFKTVIAQLDEAEGKSTAPAAEQTPDNLAATAPALELAVEGRTVAINHKNLTEVEVRYYELDVEFAFSAQPFAGPDGATAAFVQPNHQETRALTSAQPQLTFELPQQFWQKNVLVEVRAAGLVRSRQYFANALDVRFLESYGQVAVSEPTTNKPLAKTYVKVFAKLGNGQVRFHKDGYTDLRGRFDYASLSDDPNSGATRYSVLVLDESRGAVIREINPPAR